MDSFEDFIDRDKDPRGLTEFRAFPGALSKNEIESILRLTAESTQATVGGRVDMSYRSARTSRIARPCVDAACVYSRLMLLAKAANRGHWNFDCSCLREDMQLVEYSSQESGHYDWHVDIGDGDLARTRKLSISVQLSEPTDYEGGNLDCLIHRTVVTAPKERGTVIIFPSFMTHRVTPVTTGVRRSLVLFIHGASFK